MRLQYRQRHQRWLNQHSAQFIDDHRIGIFDNNILSAIQSDPFLTPDDVNRVMVYDFATDTVSEPYAALLAEAKPVSFSEGRVEFLADGGIFVEESNFGRHLRFSADALLWSRVNDYDETRIGVVSWARYLTQEDVTASLQSIAAVECAPAN